LLEKLGHLITDKLKTGETIREVEFDANLRTNHVTKIYIQIVQNTLQFSIELFFVSKKRTLEYNCFEGVLTMIMTKHYKQEMKSGLFLKRGYK
jgi:hypothetical protein